MQERGNGGWVVLQLLQARCIKSREIVALATPAADREAPTFKPEYAKNGRSQSGASG
jgi:hypothetical protein